MIPEGRLNPNEVLNKLITGKMKQNLAIGADIGGTHITTAVVNLDDNTVVRDTISTREVDNGETAEIIVEKWAESIAESIEKSTGKVRGVGIAIPGPFDYLNGVSEMEHKFQNIKGVEITKALQAILNSKIDIRYINDASAFAVGEAYTDTQRNYKRVMAITLGTGFGSAFIDEGFPVLEREDVPELGCVYYLPYKDKTADDYFSTRWFIEEYKAKTGEVLKGVKEIADLYDSSPIAKELFNEFGAGMAIFLGPWLKLFKTESLIIGGNISNAYNLFGESFENGLKEQGINIVVNISLLKEDAALLGSARLLDDRYYNTIKPALAKM